MEEFPIFNFNLAKEMGLINEHDHKLTKDLVKKILETFSLTIINEYDIAQKKKFKKIKIQHLYGHALPSTATSH